MPKVLITTNPLNHEGGVVNYYRTFLKYFKSDTISLVHLTFGSRMEHFYSPWKKRVLYPVFYLSDLLRFIWKLLSDREILIVQVSPSLIPVPLIRDAFIVLAAKLLGRHVIVFYRGWKENIVSLLKNSLFIRELFRFVYGRADVSMVLASHFKEDLIELGWPPDSIKVTTTMYVSDDILPAKDRSGKHPRFLFLGRLSHLKGIGELIDAAKLLAEQNFKFEFLMVGHGDREGVVEKYKTQVKAYGLEKHFNFTGRLEGSRKYQAYANSDIYVFPSWTEGCPNSVLEALGSGLFVISTDVGALRDIISDGKNGKIVHCQNHHHLAKALIWACKNITNIRKRRQKIKKEAEKYYTTEMIIAQFAKLYQELIDGSTANEIQ